MSELQKAHTIPAAEVTPFAVWLFQRLMIAAAALLTAAPFIAGYDLR